jgi:integrase
VKLPTYRRHSVRDLGFSQANGKRTYFPGAFGSEESRLAYAKFVDEIKRQPRQRKPTRATFDRPVKGMATVSDVVVAFTNHAKIHYPQTRPGVGEYFLCKNIGERLIRFAGVQTAESFGPLKLKAFRDSLLAEVVIQGKKEKKLSRRYVNAQLSRVRRIFRWAASEELVPESTWTALKSVDGLRAGRTEAPELASKKPVDWSTVKQVLPELSPAIARMVEIQWLTGCRPQSIVAAEASQFDLKKKIWRPLNKNEWRGQTLVIPLGPRAIKLIKAQIKESEGLPRLFCPIRTGGRANARYGMQYTVYSYRQAIQRAQKRLEMSPLWTPHQLRHGRATQIRDRFGLEAAQAVLGHVSIDATQIYASRLFDLARRVLDETG